MKILLLGTDVWQSDCSFAQDCPILWEDGLVLAVGEACRRFVPDRVFRADGFTVLPGLVDVHTHGRAGFDFVSATEEQMQKMKADYLCRGVTSVFATLASGSFSEWKTAIRRIQDCGFDGLHLEGRYLDHKKRGAHAAELLVPLDADDLEQILDGVSIPCHVTAAYEHDVDGSFAACARRHGATLGLGHTSATAEETRLAISRGVTSFTHLFNAMPPLHHREGGPVCVALGGEGYAELIADGLHICPDMVALAYRCLGDSRTVLVTDSMEATGCGDGVYSIAGQPVFVRNGRAVTEDGTLAGSTLNLWDAVKNLMRFASIPLEKAIACATRNPAKMVGIDDWVGTLEAGKRADMLIVDAYCHRRGVIARGDLTLEAQSCLVDITTEYERKN